MRQYWVRLGADEFAIRVDAVDGGFCVAAGDATSRVELTEIVPSVYTLIVDGVCHDLTVERLASPVTLTLDGFPCTVDVTRTKRTGAAAGQGAGAHGQELRAPMPGLLIALPVSEGSPVEIGQAVVIMEAMKMQMEIRAPRAGTISRVHVSPGQELSAGQLLITLE